MVPENHSFLKSIPEQKRRHLDSPTTMTCAYFKNVLPQGLLGAAVAAVIYSVIAITQHRAMAAQTPAGAEYQVLLDRLNSAIQYPVMPADEESLAVRVIAYCRDVTINTTAECKYALLQKARAVRAKSNERFFATFMPRTIADCFLLGRKDLSISISRLYTLAEDDATRYRSIDVSTAYVEHREAGFEVYHENTPRMLLAPCEIEALRRVDPDRIHALEQRPCRPPRGLDGTPPLELNKIGA